MILIFFIISDGYFYLMDIIDYLSCAWWALNVLLPHPWDSLGLAGVSPKPGV